MAEVVLLVTTTYGSTVRKGDVVDVPEAVAERWVKKGIAKFAGPQAVQQDEQDPEDGEVAAVVVDYASYKAAELQSIAKEREIPEWSAMKKADLVHALQKDDEENGG